MLFDFEKTLCNYILAKARGEAGVLNEPGRLHVTVSVVYSSLEELHVVLQLKLHFIDYDAMDEVWESGVAPEYSEEGVVVVAEHKNLAHL